MVHCWAGDMTHAQRLIHWHICAQLDGLVLLVWQPVQLAKLQCNALGGKSALDSEADACW